MPKHAAGTTEKYREEAVVRVWRNTYKFKFGFIKIPSTHFGHAAVTVRGDSNYTNGDHTHISWWPSLGAGKKQALKIQPGEKSPSYGDDKYAEMREDVRDKLEDGTFLPMPGQKQSGTDTSWEQRADAKIYLPCLYPMQDIGKKATWVGLSAGRMRHWWEEIFLKSKPAPDYKLASGKINCSGIAMQALEAGGGGVFAKPPKALFFLAPLDVERWAIKLEKRLKTLNDKVRRLNQCIPERDHLARTFFTKGARYDRLCKSSFFKDYWTKHVQVLGLKPIRNTLDAYHKTSTWPESKTDAKNPKFDAKLKGLVAVLEAVADFVNNPKSDITSMGLPMLLLGSQCIEVLKGYEIDSPDGG